MESIKKQLKEYGFTFAVSLWMCSCIFYPLMLLAPVIAFIIGQTMFRQPMTPEEEAEHREQMRGLFDNATGYSFQKRRKRR